MQSDGLIRRDAAQGIDRDWAASAPDGETPWTDRQCLRMARRRQDRRQQDRIDARRDRPAERTRGVGRAGHHPSRSTADCGGARDQAFR